jgi:hypothetical protein
MPVLQDSLNQLYTIAENLPASESTDSILRFANEAVAQIQGDLTQTQNKIVDELNHENEMVKRYDTLLSQINELPTASVVEQAELERLKTQVLPLMREEALGLMEDTAQAAKQREFVRFLSFSN